MHSIDDVAGVVPVDFDAHDGLPVVDIESDFPCSGVCPCVVVEFDLFHFYTPCVC